MSPKRTRPKTLGTNPPSALVTYPGTPTFPCNAGTNPSPRIWKQTFTPDGREAIADLISLSSGIIDSCPDLARLLAPLRGHTYSSRARPSESAGAALSFERPTIHSRKTFSVLGPLPLGTYACVFLDYCARRLKLRAGL